MTSFIIDSEQPKLLHRFTPPASRPDTTSLHDKEAHSAPGESRDTAICIPSDIESDTEDEDDASQEFHGSQSYATHTSVWDFLDLTATEYGATELDATIGANTTSAVSPTQAGATPAWPIETNESHFADARLSQQSCGVKHLLVANTSTNCRDINLTTPPTSPESQPYPVAADGKQVQPEPASQQSNMIFNAISDSDICHSSQVYQNCLSTSAQSPRTASPIEVVPASLQENEIPTSKPCNDAIPEVCTPSPNKPSNEPYQGQALGNTSSASIHIESKVTEAGFSSDAEVSHTSPSLRYFRRESSQMHKTMQYKGGDAGSKAFGSEDGLCRLGSQHREENSPPLPDIEDPGSGDDVLDDVHQGRKCLKVSTPSSCAATSSRSSYQRGPATQAQHLQICTQTSRHNIRSPTPSREPPTAPVAEPFAQFEEWPLGGAVLKRITEGSKTTFQLQFEWDSDSCQPYAERSLAHLKRKWLSDISCLAAKSLSRRQPQGDNSSSTSDTIYVADDNVEDSCGDDNFSNGSEFEYNSERNIDKKPRYQKFQRKRVQRRRWTTGDEDRLRQLKQRKLSDHEIAAILERTESGVKQHWDIIERARRCEKTKEA